MQEKTDLTEDKNNSGTVASYNALGENYDSTADTLKHIKRVNQLIIIFVNDMLKRAAEHDQSKLEEPEKSTFDKITPLLKNSTYGSEFYKKTMDENRDAINHHQLNNTHHPEFYEGGINDMTLMDIVEMFLDWKAASERHVDGDILKSIELNKGRFNINEQVCQIFRNTTKLFRE